MTILVTGGTGFLGSRLVCQLLEQGEHVHALVRGKRGESSRDRLVRVLGAIGAPPAVVGAMSARLTVLEGDIKRPDLGLERTVYEALAEEVEAIWYSAALTSLQGNRAALKAINVNGTAHVLKLGASARRAHFYHVSTAFVAGSSQDIVTEDFFCTPETFETPYEASKYAAEQLVRDWAHDTNGAATIFRPSILITDREQSLGAPPHTIQQLIDMVRPILDVSYPITLRIPGNPGGRLNFMPVESAARTMLEAVALRREVAEETVLTYNVVHSEEIWIGELLRALEEILPVVLKIGVHSEASLTALEKIVYGALPGFLPYLNHERHYAPGRLAQLNVPCPRIDRAYLVRSIQLHQARLPLRESSELTVAVLPLRHPCAVLGEWGGGRRTRRSSDRSDSHTDGGCIDLAPR